MSCWQSPVYASSVECYTFVPRQHILKWNKHVNVNKYPPVGIYFVIAGLENKYFFENLRIRELMSSRFKRVLSSWVDLPLWVQL